MDLLVRAGGGLFWAFDANCEYLLPFFYFLVDVGGCTSENMPPPPILDVENSKIKVSG